MHYEYKIVRDLPGNIGRLQEAGADGWQLIAIVPQTLREAKDPFSGGQNVTTVKCDGYLVRVKKDCWDGLIVDCTTTTAEVSGD